MSEATLFSMSGGRKIPHSRHVLVGLVPLTIDALVRVMGQALVLTYIPVCLFLALLEIGSDIETGLCAGLWKTCVNPVIR